MSGGNTTEDTAEVHLLAEALNHYIRTLSPEARDVFVGRYYFMDSMKEIAAYHGMTVPKTKSLLHRTRLGLKNYLRQEGFEV